MTAPVISAGDLVARIGEEFDDELHLSGDEARALAARIQELEAALSGLLRGEHESAEPGLCDCVDNHGKPYQSQFLADRIAEAEALLSARSSLNQDGGKP